MAALAYSTPALASQQGPVNRAVIAMRGGVGQDEHRGLGCIILDRPVYFDASRRPHVGDLALVVLHGGSLAIREVADTESNPGRGFVYIADDDPPYGATASWSKVALIGAVTRLV